MIELVFKIFLINYLGLIIIGVIYFLISLLFGGKTGLLNIERIPVFFLKNLPMIRSRFTMATVFPFVYIKAEKTTGLLTHKDYFKDKWLRIGFFEEKIHYFQQAILGLLFYVIYYINYIINYLITRDWFYSYQEIIFEKQAKKLARKREEAIEKLIYKGLGRNKPCR